MTDHPTTGGPRGPEFTVLGPEPAIDPREVARLAREIRVRFLATEESYFPETPAEAALYWSNAARQAEWMLRAEQTYLASHGIPSAEDPRDAEIRALKLDKDTLVRNQIVSLDEMKKLREQADHWCRRALAAEPTRTERLVRFALDAKALGYCVEVSGHDEILISQEDNDPLFYALTANQAAAVRAAMGEKPDAT